jgi:cytochrome c biogenesis protein ResB
MLQLLLGAFEFGVLAAPVDFMAGGAIVLLCVAAGIFGEGRSVRWFTGVPMAVCLISALGILALIMGLTPQGAVPVGGMAEASARLGFNAMTSSWAFVLVYTALLLSLGGVVARRLARPRLRDAGFYLNHAGLWLALFAAGVGSADLERYTVQVDEGAAAQTGYDAATGHPLPLPVTVRLHDFVMEEYPAAHPGARPEPRRFASDVEITTPDGRSVRGVIEVNHPLRAGGWWVYQYGYDSAAGPESRYSVVELVRDPWLGVVYAGFAMIAAGALAMIWRGRRRYGVE